jgi:hypothetical protein
MPYENIFCLLAPYFLLLWAQTFIPALAAAGGAHGVASVAAAANLDV